MLKLTNNKEGRDMKYFTMEMKFLDLAKSSMGGCGTVYCWYAQTKVKNDVLQAWGDTPGQAINDLFEAVLFEAV
jgi:hypothetical protein